MVQRLSSGKKTKLTFGCCDLAIDLMTFRSELDLDKVVTYLHARNWVNRSKDSKVIIWTKEMKLTLGCCDLAFDPMTFTSELDLDMVMTYLHAKN